jgi:hypothetical protein
MTSGEVIYIPMRVIADDEGGSEVAFTAADLARLKRILEG